MSRETEVSLKIQSADSDAPAAFVLAAGFGKRLRPLTETIPKPLVPVFHKPLVSFALDSLIAAGVGNLALNTHHLPAVFKEAFGQRPSYRERAIDFFHEPQLLDTGGGIRNARWALGEKTFFLYNGDILADLPLADLLKTHHSTGAMATLLLREDGGVANIRFDTDTGRVVDVREELGGMNGRLTVYSGIAVLEPDIFDWIPDEGSHSIVDSLIAALRGGERIGGMLVSEGLWMDLGTPAAYLKAHQLLADPACRPRYLTDDSWPTKIHPEARVDASATLEGMVAVGPSSVVGARAVIRNSILLPGAIIEPGARLEGCIVRGCRPIHGAHRDSVL